MALGPYSSYLVQLNSDSTETLADCKMYAKQFIKPNTEFLSGGGGWENVSKTWVKELLWQSKKMNQYRSYSGISIDVRFRRNSIYCVIWSFLTKNIF